jgi:hypothetical protein
MSRDVRPPTPASLLHQWVSERVSEEERVWLDDKRAEIGEGASEQAFFLAFSAVPRRLGKADLELTEEDLQDADAAREGWQPDDWSVDQAGRTLLALALPSQEADAYQQTLERTFAHADVGESVALYQSLPLLPHPGRHTARAAEGVRTNMTSVFDAVALRNPYPAEQFDDTAWNQMVLKALFVGSPLYPIYGLDRRANAALARMLVDYAHERWAAGRPVAPELWRPVGPFAEKEAVDDLKYVLSSSDAAQREAAALALSQSPSEKADAALADEPELRAAIADGRLTWKRFSRERVADPH